MVNRGQDQDGSAAQDSVDDRPRGILTEADRKFLDLSPEKRREQYSSPAASQRRRAIRERVREAIHDLRLLNNELSDEELEKAVGPKQMGWVDLTRSLVPATTFLYRVGETHGSLDTEGVLSQGVADAQQDRLKELKQQWDEHPGMLTWSQIMDLERAGYIEPEEAREFAPDRRPPLGRVDPEEHKDQSRLRDFFESKLNLGGSEES
jgi:hypothetical protein